MNRQSQLTTLEEVADFMGGSTPSRRNPAFFSGGIPWVKTTDLTNGPITTTEETLSPLGLQESSCSMIPSGSVLVAMYGGFRQIGRTGRLTFDCAINQALTAVVPHQDKLLPAFLIEWLNYRVKYWKRFAGSSRKDPNITKGDIAAFPVPLIPVAKQKFIIECLAEWNTAIEKTEQLIAAKEQRLLGVIARLYRVSESQGTPTRVASFLAESAVMGGKGHHAKKLSIKLYGKGVIARDEARKGSENTQYFVRRKGQLVYSKLDFLNGAFGIVPPELDGYESTQDLPAFDLSAKVDPVWLLGYLTRPIYYTRQLGLARGQRKARRVNPPDFLSAEIRLPPLKVQRRIAEVLTEAKRDLETSNRMLTALKGQKRGLMQKLFTGEWRVKPRKGK